MPGYTYMNADSARYDLYQFGAKPLMDCLEQTLSQNNILPRGRYVEFDIGAYLKENGMAYDQNPGDENRTGGGVPNVAGAPPLASV